MASASVAEIIPCFASMLACATEPAMSSWARRLSNSMEALISSMTEAGPPSKRPPHILFALMDLGPMPFSKIVAAAFAAALAVLYVIRPVEASPAIPKALSALVPDKAPKPVPAVSFVDAQGHPVSLTAFKGHVVIL